MTDKINPAVVIAALRCDGYPNPACTGEGGTVECAYYDPSFGQCNVGKLSDDAADLLEGAEVLSKAFAVACRVLAGENWNEQQNILLTFAVENQVCRICGCSQNNACMGGCYWVEEDLCSACAGTEEAPK